MPDQLERRLIIKTKGKTHPSVKMLLKAQGAYWDDLFDGWNLPITASQNLGFLSPSVEKKEYLLPSPNRDGRYLMGKYTTLLQTLQKQSESIIRDAYTYEREYRANRERKGVACNLRTWFEFADEPSKEGKTQLEYECELLLFKRIREITLLKEEIKKIHEELKERGL